MLAAGVTLGQAQPTAPAATPTDDNVVQLDTYVVSGFRSSLTAALDIKRESVQIVDSIVSEDIGKFPDNNLVESMQRMTGIQVTNRGAGEIGTVSIRGLNDINTTLNGQNMFISSGQAMALQDIPTTLLARVDVYKTRSSDLIENGIAGSVDVRTHRPFDFEGRRVALAARGIYQEQRDKIGPNYSALFSNRWKTANGGEVGALVNISYAETPYRDQNVTAGAQVPFVTGAGAVTGGVTWVPWERIFPTRGGVAENPIWQAGLDSGLPTAPNSTLQINGVAVPYVLARDAVFQNDFTGTRKRPAVNIALQWAPSKDAEYTFESFYFGYDNTSFNNLFFSFVDWWGGPHGPVELYPGTNIVQSRAWTPFVYGFTSGDATASKTDTYINTLSGKWNISDALKLRSALTYQTSEFDTEFFAMRADRVHRAISVNFNNGSGIPAFHFIDDPATTVNESDMTQPSLWNVAQLYDNGDRDEGSAVTWTADGEYTPKIEFLSSIKFGLRYDDREASEAERRQDSPGLGRPLTDFPELYHVNSGFFDGRAGVPSSWIVPNGLAIFNDADHYRSLYNRTKLPLVENFNVTEKNMSGYVRGDFKTFLSGHRLDGQVGARYVNVKTDMSFGAGSASEKKSKLLPSGSLRFQITPDLIARASYAETLRRPNFNQLNPNITYVRDVTNIGYGTASGGNPNLRPTQSKNYDLALEYYFGGNKTRSNAIYISLFKREIDGFVVDFRRRVTATAPGDTGPYDYILSQPDNASNGELEGYEVGLVYFPDLPGIFQGFGVQASYTSLDSSQDIPITDSQGRVTGTLNRPMFGVSDSSYNITLAYERSKVGARLSYVWREAFLYDYEAALFANPLGRYRRPEASLDFQLSYRVTDRLTMTVDATNLTEELYQSYYGENGATVHNFGTSLFSRTIAVGARYSF
ncbi:TonB-dependent receptor [Opitutus terrae]|uniref:TonB-dependent receptor n=1 Tax=Opitutus terrae TaxID=107709 RepID=UPI000323067A|nr:TonB-dependent receptor [Opitutus terrae]